MNYERSKEQRTAIAYWYKDRDYGRYRYQCWNCKKEWLTDEVEHFRYCPWCGWVLIPQEED